MYSNNNFKEQAIEYVREAVQEDNAGNYARAFPLYMNALEYFKIYLKYEEIPEIKEAVMQKFNEYLRRAEQIRAVLDGGGGVAGAANGSGAAKELISQPPRNKEQLIECVREAVQEDNAGNYARAFQLYMDALEYFKTYLKHEKNPNIKEAIVQKFNEYLRRAKQIRAMLDEGGGGAGTTNGCDAAKVVLTFNKTINSPVPSAKLFKALAVDARNYVPKIVPHIIKSIDIIEGNGDPGSIKQLNFAEGSPIKYSKFKTHFLDKENLVYVQTLIEGGELSDKISVTHGAKFESSADGGCLGHISVKYAIKSGGELAEEGVKPAKESAIAIFKAVEAYLV